MGVRPSTKAHTNPSPRLVHHGDIPFIILSGHLEDNPSKIGTTNLFLSIHALLSEAIMQMNDEVREVQKWSCHFQKRQLQCMSNWQTTDLEMKQMHCSTSLFGGSSTGMQCVWLIFIADWAEDSVDQPQMQLLCLSDSKLRPLSLTSSTAGGLSFPFEINKTHLILLFLGNVAQFWPMCEMDVPIGRLLTWHVAWHVPFRKNACFLQALGFFSVQNKKR